MKCNPYYPFFRNLANPLRIKIIEALKEKESSVSDLCDELKVEQSKLSHALASLKRCNIVKDRKEGKQRIYFLNTKTIIPILKLIDNHAKEFCGRRCCQ